MRNEKKYNKSIYFTMVFVQTIIHLVVLSEIFLKLFLIDHIVYDASSKIIIMDFIWIIILFLLENILHIFKQAAKIWITKRNAGKDYACLSKTFSSIFRTAKYTGNNKTIRFIF